MPLLAVRPQWLHNTGSSLFDALVAGSGTEDMGLLALAAERAAVERKTLEGASVEADWAMAGSGADGAGGWDIGCGGSGACRIGG